MKSVPILDTNKRPQTLVHPATARMMLKNGQAAVYRKHPFCIIVKEVPESEPEKLRLKIDPGSKTTGLAVVNDSRREVIWAGELQHRGEEIKKALDKRRALRRSRRNRHTRYRQARFDNRRRRDHWLPPSLMSRVHNIETWARRLCRSFPIGAISVEVARFDTQLIQNPEITGIEYRQGTLAGYELKEYLLEKWQRRCAYCKKTGVPLEVEHIIPQSRGGSNRASNLTISCRPCNQAKDNKTAAEFGHPEVEAEANRSLRDAAMMNATRYAVPDMLKAFGLPVETGTGGRTKWNRTRTGLGKSHWADAACVGESTPDLWNTSPDTIQEIRSKSYARRGRRQTCLMNQNGFPRTGGKAGVRFSGFQTGDMVRVMKDGRSWLGRVSVRKTARFKFTPVDGNGPMAIKAGEIVQLVDRCGSYEYMQRVTGQ